MRSPFSPAELLLLVFAVALVLVFIHVGILSVAFEKLGLSQSSVFLLLFSSLFGSAINVPLFMINAERPPADVLQQRVRGLLRLPVAEFTGKTIVAVNVGGCLVPLGFSLYLMGARPLPFAHVVMGVATVALVARIMSRPIAGLGIGMPILVAPLTAAVVSLLLNFEQSAPLAYISGTLGVLIGADLLRLGDIRKLGAPFASIGGAGTFDGIFITGIVAVLLA